MATKKPADDTQATAPQPEPLPDAGGSYLRLPDGTLVPASQHEQPATTE